MATEKKKSFWTIRKIALAVLILLYVIGIGLLMVGKNRIAKAKSLEAYAKSVQASQEAADIAFDMISLGKGRMQSKDIDTSREQLNSAAELIELIETMAPPEKKSTVSKAKNSLYEGIGFLESDPGRAEKKLDEANDILKQLSESAAPAE